MWREKIKKRGKGKRIKTAQKRLKDGLKTQLQGLKTPKKNHKCKQSSRDPKHDPKPKPSPPCIPPFFFFSFIHLLIYPRMLSLIELLNSFIFVNFIYDSFRCYEVLGRLAECRGALHNRLRTATLR